MSDYPALDQHDGTKPSPRSGVHNRRASNGSTRQRALQSTTKIDWTVVHKALSASDYAAFMDFYEANRVGSFTFTFELDDSAYTCVFAEKPYDETPSVDGGFRNLTVYLEAV